MLIMLQKIIKMNYQLNRKETNLWQLKYHFLQKVQTGRLINITLVQNVVLDPEDDTDILWRFRNGEVYREDLITSEEASSRLADIRKILLGAYEELVETVTEQQQRIVEQAETIEEQEETIQQQTNELDEISQQVDEINNEIV